MHSVSNFLIDLFRDLFPLIDGFLVVVKVTICNQSHEIIWGIAPQGYRCQNCDYDVHKKIVHQVERAEIFKHSFFTSPYTHIIFSVTYFNSDFINSVVLRVHQYNPQYNFTQYINTILYITVPSSSIQFSI